jgi:methionine-rich copper-binding protein CopC
VEKLAMVAAVIGLAVVIVLAAVFAAGWLAHSLVEREEPGDGSLAATVGEAIEAIVGG